METFRTSQWKDGDEVLKLLWMKMSRALKEALENLNTRNINSELKAKFKI